jgi:hypothetical protein
VTPNSALPSGPITVNGTNFSLFATIDVNGNPIVPTTITATQIVFPFPGGTPCGSTLRVRNPDGAFATVPFNPNPLITQQIGTSGPAAGGTQLIAIGSGFAAGTTCTIGGVPATVSQASATVVIAITPPNTPGPKPVVFTTPGGCTVSATFTYL